MCVCVFRLGEREGVEGRRKAKSSRAVDTYKHEGNEKERVFSAE